MANTVHIFGPDFPGEDRQRDERSAKGAPLSLDARRDRGRLEAVWPSTDVVTLPSSPVRGVFWHSGADGSRTMLAVGGVTLYRMGPDDTEPVGLIGFGMGNFIVSGVGPVQFAQDQDRTYILVPDAIAIPDMGPLGGSGQGGAAISGGEPVSGYVTLLSQSDTALTFDIRSRPDTTARTISVYASAMDRDAGGTGGIVATYPREVLPVGSDVFGYRVDGLARGTTYYGRLDTTAGGRHLVESFDGTTTNSGSGVETPGASVLFWDEGHSPATVFELKLPPQPAIASISREDYVDTAFDRPMSALPSGATADTNGSVGTDWTILPGAGTGAFKNAKWQRGTGIGVDYAMRVNTDGVTGDGTERVYFEEATAVDWSGLDGLTFKIISTGNEKKTGTFLALCFAEDVSGSPGDWTDIPFNIPTENVVHDIKVSFIGLPTAIRDAVKYWGLKVISEGDFVIEWGRLRSYAALAGDFEYVIQDRVERAGSDLDSRESASVLVKAGTAGSKITVNFAAVPGGTERLIWRRDVGIASRFHYVGTAAESATSYVDTDTDVSDGLTLKQGRAEVPTGCAVLQFHHGRLALYQPSVKSLWLAGVNRPDMWFDFTPSEWPDLKVGGLIGDGDGMRLPMGDAGPITAMAPMGIATGADYLGDMLVMTDRYDIRLTGDTPDTFSIGFRVRGGAASALAWTRLPDGRVAKVDPEGRVTAMDEQLRPSYLSGELEDLLRGMKGKARWRIGVDPATARLLLSCDTEADDAAVWMLDLAHGGWDRWTPGADGLPVAVGSNGDGEGGYLAVGYRSGKISRLLDPYGAASALFRWQSPKRGDAGAHQRLEALTAAFSGNPSFAVMLDGEDVQTVTPRSGIPVYLKKLFGEAVAVRVEATTPGDAVREVRVETSAWRG